MRLQVILHGGPFDGTFMSLDKTDGDWPTQIRVASGDDVDDPCMACNYARHDIDDEGTIFMGSYKFSHSFESSRFLIDHWL